MRPDVKSLLKVAKNTLDKKTYRKITKLENEKEMIHVLEYTMLSKMEKDLHQLEKQIKNKEKLMKDVFFAKTKSIILRNKIKNFSVSFADEDYNKVKDLFADIKKEIQNV